MIETFEFCVIDLTKYRNSRLNLPLWKECRSYNFIEFERSAYHTTSFCNFCTTFVIKIIAKSLFFNSKVWKKTFVIKFRFMEKIAYFTFSYNFFFLKIV